MWLAWGRTTRYQPPTTCSRIAIHGTVWHLMRAIVLKISANNTLASNEFVVNTEHMGTLKVDGTAIWATPKPFSRFKFDL